MDIIKNNCGYIALSIIVILIVIIIFLVYIIYKCQFPSINQRIWPIQKNPSNKEFMVFTSDSMINVNELFLTGKTLENSIFENIKEKENMRKQAINYFKMQFGLSDIYIQTLLLELRVNDKIKYTASHIKSKSNKQTINSQNLLYPIIDGGFILYIPKGKTLYGRYGGKEGVIAEYPSVIAYGYYIIKDEYKIIYSSPCPLHTHSTYDADYNPIDCDVEIVDSIVKDHIGLKGKAIGVYKKLKLSNSLYHISIRNVLTFY